MGGHLCIHTYARTHMNAYAHMHIHVYIHTTHLPACMHACIRTYMYIHTYTDPCMIHREKERESARARERFRERERERKRKRKRESERASEREREREREITCQTRRACARLHPNNCSSSASRPSSSTLPLPAVSAVAPITVIARTRELTARLPACRKWY